MMTLCILVIFPYLLGSIPFGLLLTRAAGLGDIRAIGSGNIGATNVMRTGHKWLGALTLLLDGAKGYAAVWLAVHTHGLLDFAALAGVFAVCGHVFPVWLRFKGGKGVATALGVLIALNLVLGLTVCAMWLAIFFFTRISSLAAIIAIGYAWAMAYVLDDIGAEALALYLAILILYTHRSNLTRLLEGSEHHFRGSKP
jgi:glycerol-3-phosphate acyltransferase PlsY